MKVINVLAIFILGFVNVNAQSDSVLIHGKYRPYVMKEEIRGEAPERRFICSIELQDAVRVDSISKAQKRKQVSSDTINRNIFICPSEDDVNIQHYLDDMPINGLKYVFLDILLHKNPHLKSLIDGKRLTFLIRIDMDGVLYGIHTIVYDEQIVEIFHNSAKELLQMLNRVYCFKKPSTYGLDEGVSYVLPIHSNDWQDLLDLFQ